MGSVFMAENLPSNFFKTNLGSDFVNSGGTVRGSVSQQLAMKTASQLRRAECLLENENFFR
jgi:hypothetical protein